MDSPERPWPRSECGLNQIVAWRLLEGAPKAGFFVSGDPGNDQCPQARGSVIADSLMVESARRLSSPGLR